MNDIDKYNSLKQLQMSQGWSILMDICQYRFEMEFKKLRNSKKSDSGYAKICGFLDGIEYVMKLPDEEIKCYEATNSEQLDAESAV